jgi:hypothetical protein
MRRIGLAFAFCCLLAASAWPESISHIANPTHRQRQLIRVTVDGATLQLHSFCVDHDGRIITVVGGASYQYSQDDQGNVTAERVDQPAYVVAMDDTGKELARATLEFKATAVNEAPDGTIFVAGEGKVAHLQANLTLIKQATSPNIADLETFKAQAIEKYKEQMSEYNDVYRQQIEQFQALAEPIEKIAEAERTEQQKSELETYKLQIQSYEDVLKQSNADVDPDEVMKSATTITSVAASENELFVCCATGGGGYEVFRTSYELEPGAAILTQLGGCCGQCDIQVSADGKVYLADNTKFKVSVFDREGAELTAFGQPDRSSKEGFGSCCNPMNVLPMADGSVYTAESSIGHIKHFDGEGKLIAYIGKAKIGGGCKHCSIGVDRNRNRYYMMYQDENAICVLAPIDEPVAPNEDEQKALAARAGLGEALVGTWEMLVADQAKPAPPSGIENNPPQAPSIASTTTSKWEVAVLGLRLLSVQGETTTTTTNTQPPPPQTPMAPPPALLAGAADQSPPAAAVEKVAEGDPAAQADESTTVVVLDASSTAPPQAMFTKWTFSDNGKVTDIEGLYASYGSEWDWECLAQDGNKLTVRLVADQVELMTQTFEFSEDRKSFSGQLGYSGFATGGTEVPTVDFRKVAPKTEDSAKCEDGKCPPGKCGKEPLTLTTTESETGTAATCCDEKSSDEPSACCKESGDDQSSSEEATSEKPKNAAKAAIEPAT